MSICTHIHLYLQNRAKHISTLYFSQGHNNSILPSWEYCTGTRPQKIILSTVHKTELKQCGPNTCGSYFT